VEFVSGVYVARVRGLVLWCGLYPQLALWATGMASAAPTGDKVFIVLISLRVKDDPSDCQNIIKRKRLKMSERTSLT
jgi:hypothetical protein